jgi:hypothetical protein
MRLGSLLQPRVALFARFAHIDSDKPLGSETLALYLDVRSPWAALAYSEY